MDYLIFVRRMATQSQPGFSIGVQREAGRRLARLVEDGEDAHL